MGKFRDAMERDLRLRGCAASTIDAYRFLYCVTLNRPEVVARWPRAKVPVRKIRVLKGSEVQRLRQAMPSMKHRTIFTVIYGCGVRVSEAYALRVDDIDAQRRRILIRCAKGHKDRYVPLGPTVLSELRRYYEQTRPVPPDLFYGTTPDGRF